MSSADCRYPDKKDLYAKFIDAINEFNNGGDEAADVPTEKVVECVGVQLMTLAQVLATAVYVQGQDKAALTQKVLLLLPMLDQMADKAFDDLVERDTKELFPNVKQVKQGGQS